MKKIRAGIIGLGRIASLYEQDRKAKIFYPYLTHAGTYVAHPKIELVCGADIDQHKLSKFQKMWDVKKVYANYKQMLSENELDILSICTYPDAQYDIVRSSLGLVKVIFCEKPFLTSSGRVRNIIRLKEHSGTAIAINLYREYDSSHTKVKRLIQNEEFGITQRVNCYYGKGLRNMGIHVLAYITGIFGFPKKIKVINKRNFYGVKEFTYDVYLEFKGNTPVIMQGCDFNKFRLFELDFICEKGRVQILDEGLSIKISRVRKNKAETGAYELDEGYYLKSSTGKALYSGVNHLISLCEGKVKEPIVSAERYLNLQLLIEKIEEQGGRV